MIGYELGNGGFKPFRDFVLAPGRLCLILRLLPDLGSEVIISTCREMGREQRHHLTPHWRGGVGEGPLTYKHTRTHTFTQRHICAYTGKHTPTHSHVCTHTNSFMHTLIYTDTPAHTPTDTHTAMCTHTAVCAHTHMHSSTLTYTHAHID